MTLLVVGRATNGQIFMASDRRCGDPGTPVKKLAVRKGDWITGTGCAKHIDAVLKLSRNDDIRAFLHGINDDLGSTILRLVGDRLFSIDSSAVFEVELKTNQVHTFGRGGDLAYGYIAGMGHSRQAISLRDLLNHVYSFTSSRDKTVSSEFDLVTPMTSEDCKIMPQLLFGAPLFIPQYEPLPDDGLKELIAEYKNGKDE